METGEKSPTIHERLLAVQMELNVPKTHYNEFGDFNYRSAEDIMNAAKPVCKAHGLLLLLSDDIVEKAGKCYVEATARAIEIDTGFDIKVTALAREPEKPKSKMDESQATGATSSYARKYALNGLFCLDDNQDPDTIQHYKMRSETSKPQDKKPVQKPAAPLAGGPATPEETEKIKHIAYSKHANGEPVFTQNEITEYKEMRLQMTAKDVIELMENEKNTRLKADFKQENTFKDDDVPF